MSVPLQFHGRGCAEEDCDRAPLNLFSQRCLLHGTPREARWLSPEDLAELQEALSHVTPLSDEEKQERRARGHLARVRRVAEDAARARADARESGATDEQIAAAQLPD